MQPSGRWSIGRCRSVGRVIVTTFGGRFPFCSRIRRVWRGFTSAGIKGGIVNHLLDHALYLLAPMLHLRVQDRNHVVQRAALLGLEQQANRPRPLQKLLHYPAVFLRVEILRVDLQRGIFDVHVEIGHRVECARLVGKPVKDRLRLFFLDEVHRHPRRLPVLMSCPFFTCRITSFIVQKAFQSPLHASSRVESSSNTLRNRGIPRPFPSFSLDSTTKCSPSLSSSSSSDPSASAFAYRFPSLSCCVGVSGRFLNFTVRAGTPKLSS